MPQRMLADRRMSWAAPIIFLVLGPLVFGAAMVASSAVGELVNSGMLPKVSAFGLFSTIWTAYLIATPGLLIAGILFAVAAGPFQCGTLWMALLATAASFVLWPLISGWELPTVTNGSVMPLVVALVTAAAAAASACWWLWRHIPWLSLAAAFVLVAVVMIPPFSSIGKFVFDNYIRGEQPTRSDDTVPPD